MIELSDITEQQSRILRHELAVRRAVEALERAPWDEVRRQHLKDSRALLRTAKRTLQQMLTDYNDRHQMRML